MAFTRFRISRSQGALTAQAMFITPFSNCKQCVFMSAGFRIWRNDEMLQYQFLCQRAIHRLNIEQKLLRTETHTESSRCLIVSTFQKNPGGLHFQWHKSLCPIWVSSAQLDRKRGSPASHSVIEMLSCSSWWQKGSIHTMHTSRAPTEHQSSFSSHRLQYTPSTVWLCGIQNHPASCWHLSCTSYAWLILWLKNSLRFCAYNST